MTRFGLTAMLVALPLFGSSTVAFAQSETTLISPAVPAGYDRGRNIAVRDKTRPEYDALGVRVGSFLFYPEAEFDLGATSNVFLTGQNTDSDGYVAASPRLRVTSDWSRHQLTLLGGGTFQHYFQQGLRDQNAWYTSALGRVDVTSDLSVSAESGIKKTYESPFVGEIQSALAVISSYYQSYGTLRGVYVAGRGRALLTYDHQDLDFRHLRGLGGVAAGSQSYRDRDVDRVTAQLEYALSPELSAYGQLSYANTNYRHPDQGGGPNRDSDSYRAIGGVNFDLTSLLRGSFGIGYSSRNYDNPIFRDVHGFSAEASIEYFPTELTTVTLELRRAIEDSNLGSSSAYFDNRASIRVDHELLKNLILDASAEAARQTYFGSNRRSTVYELQAGGDYFVNHLITLGATLSYRKRNTNNTAFDDDFDEVVGQLSLTFHR